METSEWHQWSHLDHVLALIFAPIFHFSGLFLNFFDVLSVSVVVIHEYLFLLFEVLFLPGQILLFFFDLSQLSVDAFHLGLELDLLFLLVADLLLHHSDLFVQVVDLVLQLAKLASEHHNDGDQDDDDEGRRLLNAGEQLGVVVVVGFGLLVDLVFLVKSVHGIIHYYKLNLIAFNRPRKSTNLPNFIH